ncbi:MAG: indole-3-glycerol phosphate synthase TrpC [Nitrospiraceae bacterium]|nr:indole-3-glycerol phosphate synthase TrpC [Nitrospiraceae bacterium]
MAILDEILLKRKERLAAEKRRRPIGEIKSRVGDAGPPKDFYSAIKRKRESGINLIAEVKKASPSMGLIRADFDPAGIAALYRERAAAISVLTEEDFFQGSLSYLDIVKKTSGRPVLRKDFIFDPYQIYEARAAGADALLLIAKILGLHQAGEFLAMARELGLGVLFETHDFKDLEAALRLDAPVIGINNRDLETLRVDIETTFRLKREIPAGRPVVSESGIGGRADVLRLEDAGVDAILVGTTLMKASDITKTIDGLMGVSAQSF